MTSTSTKLDIRPSTPDDIIKVLGRLPERTIRSWSGYVNDKIVGIGGVMIMGAPGNQYYLAFSEIVDRKALSKRHILLGANFLMAQIRAMRVPVYAIANEKIKTARGFLEHLGFVFVQKNEGMEVLVWQTR